MKIEFKIEGVDAGKFAPRISMMMGEFTRTTTISASRAIDKTLERARDANMAHMLKIFKSPTPYTVESLNVVRTHQRNMEGMLAFAKPLRMNAPFLAPEIFGGPRERKGLEVAMSRKFNGRFFIPSHEFLDNYGDQYGNIPGGKIRQIISALGAGKLISEESGRQDINKRSMRNKSNRDFVYIHGHRAKKSHLKAGIYLRGPEIPIAIATGRKRTAAIEKGGAGTYQMGVNGAVRARALRMVMYEVGKPTYKPLFPYRTFVDLTNQAAAIWMPKYFNDEFVKDVAKKGWRK